MPLIAGWDRNNYFNEAWQKSLTSQLAALTNAEIEVFLLPDQNEGVLDPATGTVTFPEGSKRVLYKGPARVQPRGASLMRYNNAADTQISRVQFQLPITDETRNLDVPVFAYVRVTDCELSPVLLEYDYRVFESVENANPLWRTFRATVDEEVRWE